MGWIAVATANSWIIDPLREKGDPKGSPFLFIACWLPARL